MRFDRQFFRTLEALLRLRGIPPATPETEENHEMEPENALNSNDLTESPTSAEPKKPIARAALFPMPFFPVYKSIKPEPKCTKIQPNKPTIQP
jgi:hypothetical protein